MVDGLFVSNCGNIHAAAIQVKIYRKFAAMG
jgi:hypothetical protein